MTTKQAGTAPEPDRERDTQPDSERHAEPPALAWPCQCSGDLHEAESPACKLYQPSRKPV